LIGAGLIIPLSLLFVRRQPEDLGLLPDGDPSPASAGASGVVPGSVGAPEREWTYEAAVRTPAFWRLTFTFSVVMLALSSVAVHRIPHFMDRGLDPRLVAYATALDAVAAGVSSFVLGMLADRLPARYLGVAGFLLIAAGILFTTVARDIPVMFLAMITFGSGIGGLMLIQNYVWADYFGRLHLGRIRGLVTPITLIFGGIGAPLAGYVRDATGSYTSIWLVGVGLFLLAAVVLALTPPPAPSPTMTREHPATA
jgi:MFS family permease